MKVYIYLHDPMINLVYTEDEAVDLFGPMDEDDLVEVPATVVKKSQHAYADLLTASVLLGQAKARRQAKRQVRGH